MLQDGGDMVKPVKSVSQGPEEHCICYEVNSLSDAVVSESKLALLTLQQGNESERRYWGKELFKMTADYRQILS